MGSDDASSAGDERLAAKSINSRTESPAARVTLILDVDAVSAIWNATPLT
jgi:hypothetical protein